MVDVVVRTDWSRPVTAAYAGSLRKGKAGILSFKVSDRARGSQANVSLKIYKGKRLKKTIKAGVYLCNVRAKCHWTCSLPRGTYTLKVSATDLAGNKQSKIGSARLTVR